MNTLCKPDLVFNMWHTLGRSVRVPSLWIFAQNDQYFSPTIADLLFNAYTSAGAPAKFVETPPFGSDGHMLFYWAPPQTWWPPVSTFLDGIHMPTRTVVDLPPQLEQRLGEPISQ